MISINAKADGKQYPIRATFFTVEKPANTDKCAYGRISIAEKDKDGNTTSYEYWDVRGIGEKGKAFIEGLANKTYIEITSCGICSNYVKDKDGNGGRNYPYIVVWDGSVVVNDK